jgi:DNA-binding NtrC family response regulator
MLYLKWNVGERLAVLEREAILLTLRACRGCRLHAAEMLGISVRTITNRLREYRRQGIWVPPAPRSPFKE